MNRCLNISSRTVFALSALTALVTTQLVQGQSTPLRRGTDVFHYATRTVMVAESSFPSAAGLVDVRRYEQGKASKQILDIVVTGLDSSATYHLTVFDGFEDMVVGELKTDAYGRGVARFRSVSNGQSLGAGRLPLPEIFTPVDQVAGISIYSTEVTGPRRVLTADLSNPTRFGYLVKRDVSTDTVRASLWTKANNEVGRTWLLVYPVTPNATYKLFLDGSEVQTLTSNSRGMLRIYESWDNPADVLDLHTFEVKDDVGVTVLTTTLP